MSVCTQRRFFDSLHQLAEGWISAQLCSQHQRIDEKSDQLFCLRSRPMGHRCSNRNVFLSAVAPQQELERRQQTHEQRHPFSSTQRLQLVADFFRQVATERLTMKA